MDQPTASSTPLSTNPFLDPSMVSEEEEEQKTVAVEVLLRGLGVSEHTLAAIAEQRIEVNELLRLSHYQIASQLCAWNEKDIELISQFVRGSLVISPDDSDEKKNKKKKSTEEEEEDDDEEEETSADAEALHIQPGSGVIAKDILQSRRKGSFPDYGLCEAHEGSPSAFLCKTCSSLICSDCALLPTSTHASHVFERLEPRHAHLFRQQLEASFEQLLDFSLRAEAVMKGSGEAIEKVTHAAATSVQTILATKEELLKEIERVASEAIDRVKEHELAKVDASKKAFHSTWELKKQCDVLMEELGTLLRTGSPGEICHLRDRYRDCTLFFNEDNLPSQASLEEVSSSVAVTINDYDLAQAKKFIHTSIAVLGHKEVVKLKSNHVFDIQSAHRSVFVAGGQLPDGTPSRLACLYNTRSRDWNALPPMGEPRNCGPALGYSMGLVYVAGGESGGHVLKSAEAYELARAQWIPLSSMRYSRKHCSGVFLLDGLRFVVTGGQGELKTLKSCEAFDILEQRWEQLPSLGENRSSHATLLFKACVLVVGGFDVKTSQPLASCELLDPAPGNSWVEFPPLVTARHSFGATVVEDNIVVAGGVVFPTLDYDLSLELFDGARWSQVSMPVIPDVQRFSVLSASGPAFFLSVFDRDEVQQSLSQKFQIVKLVLLRNAQGAFGFSFASTDKLYADGLLSHFVTSVPDPRCKLQVGDEILQIEDKAARKMSHEELTAELAAPGFARTIKIGRPLEGRLGESSGEEIGADDRHGVLQEEVDVIAERTPHGYGVKIESPGNEVRSLLPHSKTKLKIGDRIIAIDGVSVVDIDLEDLVAMFRRAHDNLLLRVLRVSYEKKKKDSALAMLPLLKRAHPLLEPICLPLIPDGQTKFGFTSFLNF